jgi:hypothetical protein
MIGSIATMKTNATAKELALHLVAFVTMDLVEPPAKLVRSINYSFSF